MNHSTAVDSVASSVDHSVKLTASRPAAEKTMIWPSAMTELPSTLPASRARRGIAVAMISMIRDCFSSTTLAAIC